VSIHITFSDDELALLLNCIGETLEAVEDFELQTRTGRDRAEIQRLRQKLANAGESW
jgi:hypothetical protein